MNATKTPIDPRTAAAARRRLKLASELAGRAIESDQEALQILVDRGLRRPEKIRKKRASAIDPLVDQAAAGFDGRIKSLAEETGIDYKNLLAIRAGRVAGARSTRILLALFAARANFARGFCKVASKWLEDLER